MTHPTAFGYCQARLQARYAALPGESDWQRLESARTLGAFLEDARSGPMQRWVAGLSARSAGRDLERGPRDLARESVAEVAGWVPAPWRPTVAWVAWLPDLPVLEHLARERHQGQAPRATTTATVPDPWPVLPGGEPPGALTALERADLATLLSNQQPGSVAARWAAVWEDRWPACTRAQARDLTDLRERIAGHLERFRAAAPADAWGLRRALRERLRLAFHQRPLTPVAPFIYLALVLLDLERLRAELLRRALFPSASA